MVSAIKPHIGDPIITPKHTTYSNHTNIVLRICYNSYMYVYIVCTYVCRYVCAHSRATTNYRLVHIIFATYVYNQKRKQRSDLQ